MSRGEVAKAMQLLTLFAVDFGLIEEYERGHRNQERLFRAERIMRSLAADAFRMACGAGNYGVATALCCQFGADVSVSKQEAMDAAGMEESMAQPAALNLKGFYIEPRWWRE